MTHRLSRAQFEELCAVAGRSDAHGPLESAEHAWQIHVTAEERAADIVEDVVMSLAQRRARHVHQFPRRLSG